MTTRTTHYARMQLTRQNQLAVKLRKFSFIAANKIQISPPKYSIHGSVITKLRAKKYPKNIRKSRQKIHKRTKIKEI